MNARNLEQTETGMSIDEMKAFIRNHFEQFVNRKNLDVANVNFVSDSVNHGADVPPGTPPGPAGAKQYVGIALKRFPDTRVTIEDIIAESDKVVVRNVWRATDPASGHKVQFAGIVIWRIARGQIAERWAYGGVIEGRKVFANIVKYIRMGASSNFGNMFSVLGASTFHPFLPMAPIQVLTNNLLYDFSQVPIPADAVDEEQVTKPRPWDIGEIRRFILYSGPISSIFDYTTFFVMLWIFHCWDPSRATLFQTGWFVESLMTQTLIIHVIRTNRIPFL